MSQPELTPAQEAMAQQLSAAIQQEAQGILEQIARTLVATDDRSLFGATEFTLRELVLRIAGRAVEIHLREKKTATRAVAYPARGATTPPATTPSATAPR